jgi:hypothetical protein
VIGKLRSVAIWNAWKAYAEVRQFPVRFKAWRAFRRQVANYHLLSDDDLRATRRSDTVFIFGSGASLNEISTEEWRSIEAHDTIGFNWFVRQTFVRCDYHLMREVGPSDLYEAGWLPHLTEFFSIARTNPKFADTIFLLQTGFRATNGNRSIGLGLAPRDHRIFLWRSLVGAARPSLSLARGLAHGQGTLNECINLAFLLGWTRIVLAGVDLYDRRYFWLGHDEPRPDDPVRDVNVAHKTVSSDIVEGLGRWREMFEKRGVGLFVYNPRSLLREKLPLWSPSAS